MTIPGARSLLEEEVPELLRFLNEVFHPNLSAPLDVSHPFFFGSPQTMLDNFRVISINGKIVSHVGICEQKAVVGAAELQVAWIGAVATDPAHRSRGFVRILMEDALRLLRERNCDLALLNGPRRLYERSGFDLGGAELRFNLSARCVEGLTDTRCDVWRFEGAADDVARITAAHEDAPVRIQRTPSDTKTLFHIPDRSTYCAGAGSDFAYAMVDVPSAPRGGGRELSILDFGGNLGLVVRLLEYLFATAAATTVSIHESVANRDRCELFLRIADGYSVAPFANMRVISLRQLFQKMAPVLSQALAELERPPTGTIGLEWYADDRHRESMCLELEAGAVHVRDGLPDTVVRLDSVGLVQLLYGLRVSHRTMCVPSGAASLEDILPLDIYASKIDRH